MVKNYEVKKSKNKQIVYLTATEGNLKGVKMQMIGKVRTDGVITGRCITENHPKFNKIIHFGKWSVDDDTRKFLGIITTPDKKQNIKKFAKVKKSKSPIDSVDSTVFTTEKILESSNTSVLEPIVPVDLELLIDDGVIHNMATVSTEPSQPTEKPSQKKTSKIRSSKKSKK